MSRIDVLDAVDVLSVRVDLLPPELARQARARNVLAATGAALLLWLVALGGVYAWQLGNVADARRERDSAQTQLALQQAQAAELQPYRELQAQRDERETVLIAALGDQVAIPRVLDELATYFPATSSLRALNLTIGGLDATAAATDPAAVVDPAAPIGSLALQGYSVAGYAPGVEDVLADVEEAGSLVNAFLQQGADEEINEQIVATFQSVLDIEPSAYTGRYRDGLPEEAR